MASRSYSVQLDADLGEALEARARDTGQPTSDLMLRYIEQGFRMEAHPGIVFRDGPAGRRPSVQGGPDVWEVIRVPINSGTSGEAAVSAIVEHMDLTPSQARAAVGYYAAYKDEIDAWIRGVDETAVREEAKWRRERGLPPV
jgi:hypothetical protein